MSTQRYGLKHGFFGVVLLAAIARPAFAEPMRGIGDAYAAYRGTIAQLSQGDIVSPVTAAVRAMVAEGIVALREAGRPDLAARYEKEWATRYNRPLTAADWVPGLAKDDLGDHAPASQWLADFYDTLLRETMGVIRQIRLIEDINTLNYALPVVFAPKGAWRTGRNSSDQIEYRKHFIPFANIVTYWVADSLCLWAVAQYLPNAPQMKRICQPAAEQLEHNMGRYVAWKISDYIFLSANSAAGSRQPELTAIDYDSYESSVLAQTGGLQ